MERKKENRSDLLFSYQRSAPSPLIAEGQKMAHLQQSNRSTPQFTLPTNVVKKHYIQVYATEMNGKPIQCI